MTETYEDESMEDLGTYIQDINVKPFMLEPIPESHDYNEKNELLSPLIWMFHDRCLNAKVNKIHERALRIVYKDSHADYEALLSLDNAVSIHQRNLQYLMIEIYKTKHNLNPSFMSEIFETRNVHYDLRPKNNLCIPKARTTSYGIETVRYLGQKLWQTLPLRIRESESLATFKKELRAHTL